MKSFAVAKIRIARGTSAVCVERHDNYSEIDDEFFNKASRVRIPFLPGSDNRCFMKRRRRHYQKRMSANDVDKNVTLGFTKSHRYEC